MIGITSNNRAFSNDISLNFNNNNELLINTFRTTLKDSLVDTSLGQISQGNEVTENLINNQTKEEAVSSIYRSIDKRRRREGVSDSINNSSSFSDLLSSKTGNSYSSVNNELEENLKLYDSTEALQTEFNNRNIKMNPRVKIDPDSPMSFERAEIYSKQYDEDDIRENIIANTQPGLLGNIAKVGGYLTGAILDPINLIPITGGASAAGQSVKTLALRGLTEGVVGNALLEPTLLASKADRLDDSYTINDSIANLALGGLIGAGLSSTVGTIVNKLNRRSANKVMNTALTKLNSDLTSNEKISVSSMFGAAEKDIDYNGLDDYIKFKETPEFSEPDIDNNINFITEEDIDLLTNMAESSPELSKILDDNLILKKEYEKLDQAYEILKECILFGSD